MNKLVVVLLLLLGAGAKAQTDELVKPDYKAIEKNSKDKNSPLFFDSLLERFNRADTTLTVEDKRHLYFGYSFTKKYSPYGSNTEAYKELTTLLNKPGSHNRKGLEKLIALCDKILKEDPFSIKIREYRLYFLKTLGRTEELLKEDFRLNCVLDAILSTGDGTSTTNCFYVISVANEYEIINILGFNFNGEQALIENNYDYLELEKNAYNIAGFYFDISRSLQSLKF